MREFDIRQWLVPDDIADRGLDALPEHPYVHDATRIWEVITSALGDFVGALFATDAQVTDDPDLRRWYAELRTWLVDVESVPALDGRAGLTELLSVLLYNNVVHEVCGNLAPLASHGDGQADPGTVNIDHLHALAASITDGAGPDWVEPTAAAADVFLLDQAMFTSRFNVGGNNLLHLDADAFTDDPKTQAVAKSLQDALRTLDSELAALDRPVRFNAMLPRKWEASISF